MHQGAAGNPGELRPHVVTAQRDGALTAVATLQPAVAVAHGVDSDTLSALMPHLASVGSGLLKTREPVANAIWERLRARGRRAQLDRIETAYALAGGALPGIEVPAGVRVRGAERADLPLLVDSARASLREENRPDPFSGDPGGFRRWVAGRVARATIVELDGEPRFVGYADVQRREGWLVQGVYTWPEARRQGLASAGVAAICRQAFAAGADHVQLAVVEDNRAAEQLYERLGFSVFARLRTVLFA